MIATWKRACLLLVCFLLVLPVSGLGAAAPAADGPNLLQNPGFEGPFFKQCCQGDLSKYLPNTPIDEVQVAHGWAGWWSQPGPTFHRPEWREANCGDPCGNRYRTGGNAQKYFTFFSTHEAGMLQQVHGVTPGARLRFSVYMQAWSTHENFGASSGQGSMGMRIGIDPFGGTDPFSRNIVWSPVAESYDAWRQFTVEAVAQGSTVTVFTRSRPDFPLQHNDIYIDDASLVVVGTGTVGSQPPPAATVAAPATTGGFIYVVQPRDNYYRIARKFNVSVAALLAANPSANPNILPVGARLTIPGVSAPAGGGTTTTPAPTATAAPNQPPSQLPGAITHIVQRGDNLYRLSVRYGVSIARIKQINQLTSDIIFIGQTLIIAP